ncbi:MAG TPA: hypothetical protein VK958_06580 [Methylophilus sp.]|uniref:hypothetical protein n=1 Tax=Methylophilus sp. TaxID=29541 RepID=UPI002C895EFB|nr:hypothetical protein [Methylophilus sp.]HSH86901.1 hypothetical protein [Methylophilus sp.]
MQANRKQRAAGEIQNRFKKQMDLMIRACKAFDAGQEIEAENIVVRLRVLLHHNPSRHSHALLAQLNLLNNMAFVDSGIRRNEIESAITAGLAGTDQFIASFPPSQTGLVVPGIVNGKGKFVAPLIRARFPDGHPYAANHSATTTFADWWNTPFIETTTNHTFSRYDIIRILANQDGGAHVDPMIDIEFSDFCQDYHQISYGFGNIDNLEDRRNVEPVESNIVYASIRQIAFEVMATLDDHTGSNWVSESQPANFRPQWQPILTPFAIIGSRN